ncbi:FtsQ-type POTRA domain-containing protein [Adlercreutzia sp. R7]|uniref:FtsQ-type POTRA domain-containing protein n=1 Tax=Adlercreutzia wanghongyangiae TaxID=3111451 RepID=A0ABU6IIW2_9ACTN|nr:FtsQ-type POTRA domain-containing protein [Adlercreutzia sp. R7]
MDKRGSNNPRYNKSAARRAVSATDRPARPAAGRAARRAGVSTPTARAKRPGVARAAKPAQVSSVRLGDLDRVHRQASRREAVRQSRSAAFKAIIAVIVVAVLGVGTYAGLYFSPVFTIEEVTVTGADHLTSEEMAVLAAVPQGTTLLNVDAGAIEDSVVRDSWVADVDVRRLFPGTLEIVVTERAIAAVVDVVADNAKTTQHWAIASDGMWLMEIPDQDSELGQSISPQIYEDAANVLHIKDVPFGLTPEVGTYCTDDNVNNALAILDGLSTDLADQVKTVSATDAASTQLTLDNGIEIAFGTADDIRDKERICLKIMEEHPGKVAYINVRVVDRPTWRAV